MNGTTTSFLEERIRILEHQQQVGRRALVLFALLGLVVLVVTGAAASQRGRTLEANEFHLRYPDGSLAASLEIDHEGMPLLFFQDQKEKIRTSLRLTKEGRPWFNLVDENGEQKLAILLGDDGAPLLGMGGKDDCQVVITARPKGVASVEASAGDPKSKAAAGLYFGQNGEASVVVVGPDGKSLFSAPTPPKP